MTNNKNNEDNFFKDAPLESIESIVNDDNWGDDEPAVQNGKKSIARFIFIKLITIAIILYLIMGYKLDIQYYFQDIAVKDFGKVNITTLKKIKMEEFKNYNNSVVSISGWIEMENSFSMKLNFKKYKILKLWRKPIFVVLPDGNDSFVATEGTLSDISYLKQVKGRLLTCKHLSNGFLNSYDGIISAYKRASVKSRVQALKASKGKISTDDYKSIRKLVKQEIKEFSSNGVIIIADSLPGQNILILIIPALLFLYILYSIFAIIRIFKTIKSEKNT